jgi:hypothetical protein
LVRRRIRVKGSEVRRLYLLLDEALYVIDRYHSLDDVEYSEDPDYAMDRIEESLEDAKAIVERWLAEVEGEPGKGVRRALKENMKGEEE